MIPYRYEIWLLLLLLVVDAPYTAQLRNLMYNCCAQYWHARRVRLLHSAVLNVASAPEYERA